MDINQNIPNKVEVKHTNILVIDEITLEAYRNSPMGGVEFAILLAYHNFLSKDLLLNEIGKGCIYRFETKY